jgi:quinol monooxygenase YgiN
MQGPIRRSGFTISLPNTVRQPASDLPTPVERNLVPIRVVINTHVRDEHRGEMFEYWKAKSEMCQAEEGNLQYEIFESIIDPSNIALLELWADQRTYDKHWQNEMTMDKPSFDRGPRRMGRDGVEFYYDHKYYRHQNGIWQVHEDQIS